MRYVVGVLCVLSICSFSIVGAQQGRSSERRRAVVVPQEVALPAIVQQPGCPLRILKMEKLFLLDGWPGWKYQVRNEGSQPIRSYSIAEVSSAGTGSLFTHSIKPTGKFLMPGDSDAPGDPGVALEIVPLTKQLREQFKVGETLRSIMLFMVVRVEYADGTVYEDQSTKDALTKFFLDNPIQPQVERKTIRERNRVLSK